MYRWVLALCELVLLIMAVNAITMIVLAGRYFRNRRWEREGGAAYQPSVAILIPAYNEEPTIGPCITSMFAQTYRNLSLVVVDDGSSDNTRAMAERAASKAPEWLTITITRKPNGGKASALNRGLLLTDADIVVSVDADSALDPDAISRLVAPFADPRVGAVAGVVRIANTRRLLGRQQELEYVGTINLSRSAFAELGALQVMSGAMSAFRRSMIAEVGGYSHATLTEDFDVTVAVQRSRRVVLLHPAAIAYTEGPLTYRDLYKQRHRWMYGGFQVLAKYRDEVFSDKHGKFTRVGLPHIMIFPWLDVLVSALSILAFAVTLFNGYFLEFLSLVLIMLAISSAGNLYALHLSRDRLWKAVYGLPMLFWYSHVTSWATLRAGWDYVRRKEASWDKLARSGRELERPQQR